MRNAAAIGGIALFAVAVAVAAAAPSDARADGKDKRVFVDTGDDGTETVWIRLSPKQREAVESGKERISLSRIQRAMLKRALGGADTDYKWTEVALRVAADQLREAEGTKGVYVVRPKSELAAKRAESSYTE